MKKLLRLLAVTMILALAAPALSQANQWRFDEAHTRFFFDARHTFSLVRGQFDDFSGSVWFDPEKPETGRFEFTIPVKSINTNISKRDSHLLSDDFFSARTYPLITFKSTKVTPSGDKIFLVDGILTIKDVSKYVTLPFTFLGQKANPLNPGEIVAGLEATLTINRLEYHVGTGQFAEIGVVGRDVDIIVTLELLRDK